MHSNTGCDVILIVPPGRRHVPYVPIGLLYISSFLEGRGISTRVINFTQEVSNYSFYLASRLVGSRKDSGFFKRKIIDAIRACSPGMVGISCYTSEYNWVMETARMVKEETGVPVTVGGVHPTLKPGDFIFPGSPVSYAVMGEGESPFAELLAALKAGRTVEGLGHITYLADNGVMVTGACNVERDIRCLPYPDYTKVDMRHYTRPYTRHIRGVLLSGVEILTSRGCPYACEFCANNYLQINAGDSARVRYRDISGIMEELKFLSSAYGIDGFYILDDCFLLSKERVEEFCRELMKSGLGMMWAAETRVNLVNDEALLRLMKKAGLLQLDFGVESGSPAMLEAIRKGITVEQIEKAFAMCARNGIRTFANIMFNLPGETEQDIGRTEQLLARIKPAELSILLTVPYLGSRIYEKYVSPELSKSEYDIYNQDVFRKILDKRFFLAKHTLDFSRLIDRVVYLHRKQWRQKAGLGLNYWKKILRGRHSLEYLLLFFMAPVDSFIISLVKIDAVIFHNFFRRMVRKIAGAYSG